MQSLSVDRAPVDSTSCDEDAFLEALKAARLIDANNAARLEKTRAKTGEPFCRLIPKLALMEERTLSEEAARFLGLPLFKRDEAPEEPLFADVLNAAFLKAEGLLPLRIEAGHAVVATVDPFSSYHKKAIELASKLPVRFVVAQASEIDAAHKRLYEAGDASATALDGVGDADAHHEDDLQRLRDLAAEAPVIRYVNQLLHDAVGRRASDIHFEPFNNDLRIRFRIDGMLREIDHPSANMAAAIISRVKLLAKLNIAERRLPQDGRLQTVIRGKSMDVRVSTVPTLRGESVVLRLLDKTSISFDFNDLGFGPEDLARYLQILSNPNGITLVTGPTGSGKTTSLYASLLHLNDIETKILTVEDPIEYELPGINQVQVKPQIGLTFANALRSLVRQDPDIILIGEIRDLETAEIACQSALTGHRVLSTLHTNDAASSVTRLLDMGVPDFLIAATVRGIVAQRLVRRLCDVCKTAKPCPPEFTEDVARLGVSGHDAMVHEPQGCAHCEGTGFRGRIGIYEILIMSEGIRHLVRERKPASDIQALAAHEGMTTMFEDGLRKSAHGFTSIAEVLRATREA